jgi:hypothetical protein
MPPRFIVHPIEPMPGRIEPMQAKLGLLPGDDAAFAYEVKWDGIRAVARLDRGHLDLTGRNGTDYKPRYPELRPLGAALGSTRAILDGEIVAFDEQGKPSFERLQSRMHLTGETAIKRRAAGGHPRTGPRGHRRQAARLRLRAGPPLRRLDQGQERPAPGGRDRRLVARRGQALGTPRGNLHRRSGRERRPARRR